MNLTEIQKDLNRMRGRLIYNEAALEVDINSNPLMHYLSKEDMIKSRKATIEYLKDRIIELERILLNDRRATSV